MHAEWTQMRRRLSELLAKEAELQEVVQLVGPDALAESERAVLGVARMLREDFLQQSALDAIDQHSVLDKTYWMLKAVMVFYEHAKAVVRDNRTLRTVVDLPVTDNIARMKQTASVDSTATLSTLVERVRHSFEEMEA